MRVLELAGIGPGPFCAMMLADQGATVLRIDRPGAANPRPERDLLNRGRQSAVLDLKHPRATDALLRLVDAADVLLEGFRPGVTERLGVGPDVCLRRNPRLVYARMTGWGQHGPMATAAGHDIGYIARAGALHGLGRAGGPPQFPANLLGDFGGGGMLLAYGICAALVERATSGRGQVVDAAIVDGAASLLAMPLMLMAQGGWRDERGVNLLDGGVPWYDVYETADGKWMAVGALEPQFYAALLAGLGLTDVPARNDPQNWPELRALFAARFKDRTRDEWAAAFAGTDACVEPVLSMHEAAADPHLTARETYVVRDGVTQPSPAPRFSRTPAGCPSGPPRLASTRPRRSPSGAWPTRRTWSPAAPPSRPSRARRRFGALIEATPSLRAYQSDMMDQFVGVTAVILAERVGLSPDDPEPQITATALLGLWRIQFQGLSRYLDGTRTPEQVRQAVTADVRRAAQLINTGLSSLPA